jgi:hypothetical protein
MALDKTPDRVGSRNVTLRNDKIHNLYLLYTVLLMVIWRRMRSTEHVARVKKYINKNMSSEA